MRSIEKKRKRRNTKNRVIATVLIFLGLVLISYGFKDSIKSRLLRKGIEEEMTEQIQETFSRKTDVSETDDSIKETVWVYPTEEHEPVIDRDENMKEYAPIGAFVIPKIDQTIAVMDGVGGNNMYRGASEQYLDQEMGVGNYVLSSHRMYNGTLFARLEEVEVGDEVYLTDYEKVYKYEVTESDNNVEVTRTHLLQDIKYPILTFYGCTSDGTMRVVKQAKLIGYSLIEDLGDADRELILENIN